MSGRGFSAGEGFALKVEVAVSLLATNYHQNSSKTKDAGGTRKLLALIPDGIREVGMLKGFLRKKLNLTSHSNFDIYNGEFLIPDQEDIRIFSHLTDVCRLVPCDSDAEGERRECSGEMSTTSTSSPSPQSSMTSRRFPSKRGKFLGKEGQRPAGTADKHPNPNFVAYQHLSSAGAYNQQGSYYDRYNPHAQVASGLTTFGEDAVDLGYNEYSSNSSNSYPPRGHMGVPRGPKFPGESSQPHPNNPPTSGGLSVGPQGGNPLGGKPEEEMDMWEKIALEKKRRRRKRRRAKAKIKAKMEAQGLADRDEECDSGDSSGDGKGGYDADVSISELAQSTPPTHNKTREKAPQNNLGASDKSAAPVDENVGDGNTTGEIAATSVSHKSNGSTAAACNSGSSETWGKTPGRLANKGSSDSSFLSPNTVFSGGTYRSIKGSNTSDSSAVVSTGKRKDTPMLPRILKNPCETFYSVKKTLSFACDTQSDKSYADSGAENSNLATPNSASKSEENYAARNEGHEITDCEQLHPGNLIKFQLLELDAASNSPVVNERTASIVEVLPNQQLKINFTDHVNKEAKFGSREEENSENDENEETSLQTLSLHQMGKPRLLLNSENIN